MTSIQFDNRSESYNTNISSISWNHQIYSNSNSILVIGISWRNIGAGTETISGITYNGNACTLIRNDEYFASASCSTALYYIINPPIGTYSVVVTFTGTIFKVVGGCSSFTQVNQSNPIDVHSGQAGIAGTSASTNITSTKALTTLVDVICGRNTPSTATSDVAQSDVWNYFYGASNTITGACSLKNIVTAQATSMSWTLGTGTERWSQSIVAIAPILVNQTHQMML